ncbi:MAG TPA: hypothetical protein DD490_22150 [Acidobacteria bacterium]|nr:hypothetical protein [Acidobacteriota bacterium]
MGIALCLGLLAALPVVAQEEEEKSWTLEFGADYATIYLFRGVDLLADENAFVPRAQWTWNDFAVTYFGYFGDLPGANRYVEGDLSIDKTFHLGEVASLTLGGLTYQFNGDAERELAFLDTYEVYGIFALDVLLSPTVSYYHDIDKIEGGYLTVALSHSVPLGSRASLDFLGSVGFDFHYNNKAVSEGTLNDALFAVDLPVQLNDHFSLHAGAQRSIALEALDEIVEADPSLEPRYGDQTVYLAGATVSF